MTRIGRRNVIANKDPKDIRISELEAEILVLKQHLVILEATNKELQNDNDSWESQVSDLEEQVETLEN